MVYYPLFDKQKENVLNYENVGKRVLGMSLKYVDRLRDEQVKQAQVPIPPSIKTQFLSLISACISKTRQTLELIGVLRTRTDIVLSNIQDLINTYRIMAIFYSSTARSYMLKNNEFQIQAVYELSSLETLLDELTVRTEGSTYGSIFTNMKALTNKMIQVKDVSIRDINDIFRNFIPSMEQVNIPVQEIIEPIRQIEPVEQPQEEEKKSDENVEVARVRRVIRPVNVDMRTKEGIKQVINAIIDAYQNDIEFREDIQNARNKINYSRITLFELRDELNRLKNRIGL